MQYQFSTDQRKQRLSDRRDKAVRMHSNRSSQSLANRRAIGFPRALVILLAAFLAACATRPDEGESVRTLLPQEAVNRNLPEQPPLVRTRDNVHDVLALSAGGPDGAFGAGVLAGWTKSGKRPEFDVVTGVSTGALLSVFAFLGPQWDDLARELYTSQTNDTIFKKRGLRGVLGDSLYDNTPLKAQIEKYITEDVLRRVAAEHQRGRRLYVATTNLDAGELVIWDMGKIALGGRTDPLQHFQKVLRASAAVPGFFQPVYIKPQRGTQLRQAHVDGGVKEPILYADFMGQTTAPDKNLYLVVNGTTQEYNDAQPVKPNLASIAQKTIFELMREIQSDTIFRHYIRARNTGMDFRVVSIPDEIPISTKSLDFDPVRMRSLYSAGFQLGLQGPDSWARKPRGLRGANDEELTPLIALQN